MGGTEGYIPVGAGPKGTVEGAALGGSPDGTEGGALGLFQGLEPGQPCAWAGFVLLTEVLAGECSGSASANENSSDIFLKKKKKRNFQNYCLSLLMYFSSTFLAYIMHR